MKYVETSHPSLSLSLHLQVPLLSYISTCLKVADSYLSCCTRHIHLARHSFCCSNDKVNYIGFLLASPTLLISDPSSLHWVDSAVFLGKKLKIIGCLNLKNRPIQFDFIVDSRSQSTENVCYTRSQKAELYWNSAA